MLVECNDSDTETVAPSAEHPHRREEAMRRKSLRPLTLAGMALAFLCLFIALSFVPPSRAAEAQSSGNSVQDLSLEQSGLTSIDVFWDPPASLPSHYEVTLYSGDTTSGASIGRKIKYDDRASHQGSNFLHHRFNSLTAEQTYTVTVGVWLLNASSFTDHVSATITLSDGSVDNQAATPVTFPGAVTGLSVTGVPNGLSVSWTERPDSENIYWYEIQHTADGSDYNTSTSILVSEGNSLTIDNLTPGQEEKVRVRACAWSGVIGESEYCGAWTETTGTPTAPDLLEAPSAPQNLRLSLDGSRLKVKWDAPATGWEPAKMIKANSGHKFRYMVVLQDETSGEAMRKRPGYKKQQVVFRNLTDGATYKVSVQARIRDAQRNSDAKNDNWVKSEWVSDSITVE